MRNLDLISTLIAEGVNEYNERMKKRKSASFVDRLKVAEEVATERKLKPVTIQRIVCKDALETISVKSMKKAVKGLRGNGHSLSCNCKRCVLYDEVLNESKKVIIKPSRA